MLAFPDKTGSLVLAACIWFLFVHPHTSAMWSVVPLLQLQKLLSWVESLKYHTAGQLASQRPTCLLTLDLGFSRSSTLKLSSLRKQTDCHSLLAPFCCPSNTPAFRRQWDPPGRCVVSDICTCFLSSRWQSVLIIPECKALQHEESIVGFALPVQAAFPPAQF